MSLEELRSKIDILDKQIIELLRQRQQLSLSIGKEKKTLGFNIDDSAREKTVLSHIHELSVSSGLNPNFTHSIYQSIIASSKEAQKTVALQPELQAPTISKTNYHHVEETTITGTVSYPKIAVIGAGKMGMWIARLLLSEKISVVLIDNNARQLSAASSALKTIGTTDFSAATKSDIVVIAVPILAFETCAKELANILVPSQKVIDITSVKEIPVRTMHTYLPQCLTLGAHPLFGPGAQNLAKQNVVLTPTNTGETEFALLVKQWLESHNAIVSIMTPAEHDDVMSIVLGLAHFIAIVSGDTLLHNTEIGKAYLTSGTTFRALTDLVKSVLSEDPLLYSSIQTHLPKLDIVENEFVTNANEWAIIVRNRDTNSFVSRMTKLCQLQNDLSKNIEDTSI